MGREDYIILVREDDRNGILVSACIFCNILSHLRVMQLKKKYSHLHFGFLRNGLLLLLLVLLCCRCCYFVGFVVSGVADAVGFWINPVGNETASSQ